MVILEWRSLRTTPRPCSEEEHGCHQLVVDLCNYTTFIVHVEITSSNLCLCLCFFFVCLFFLKLSTHFKKRRTVNVWMLTDVGKNILWPYLLVILHLVLT